MGKRAKTLLDVIRADRELAALYAEEDLLFEITEAIARAMKLRDVSQADLARKLGISRQAVSAVLQGRNVTVRRAARFLHALGFRLRVELDDQASPYAGEETWSESVNLRLVEPQTTWQESVTDRPGSAEFVA